MSEQYATHFEPDEVVFLIDGERVGSMRADQSGAVLFTGYADALHHLFFQGAEYIAQRIEVEKKKTEADKIKLLKANKEL